MAPLVLTMGLAINLLVNIWVGLRSMTEERLHDMSASPGK
jgi:hypothetical protein